MRRRSFHHWAIGVLCVTLLPGCLSGSFAGSLFHRAAAADVSSAVEESQTDDEVNEFLGLMRHDLTIYRARERQRIAVTTPQQPAAATASSSTLNATAAPTSVSISNESRAVALRMPVAGVTRDEIENSWGDPRDGGTRPHRGIDIFAPRGTQVVAVTEGYISYIGDQPKGGHCLWLVSNDGMSFYYAHLDRWAPGLYEGLEVKSGDVLGFVGNTGNAAHTASHLHFSVLDNDEAVNPYNLLKYGRTGGHVVLHGGLTAGGTR